MTLAHRQCPAVERFTNLVSAILIDVALKVITFVLFVAPDILAKAVAKLTDLGTAATIGFLAGRANQAKPVLALTIVAVSSVGNIPKVVEGTGGIEIEASTTDAVIVLVASIELIHKITAIAGDIGIGPVEGVVVVTTGSLNDTGRDENLVNAMDNTILADNVGQNHLGVAVDQHVEIIVDGNLHSFSLDSAEAVSIEYFRRQNLSTLDNVVFDNFEKISRIDQTVEAKGAVVGECLEKILKRLICGQKKLQWRNKDNGGWY